ncbi:MAG: amidase [Verrucomicrobiae bacterium]|nr:amidase [Verrucomicrobiae bacterium]
MSESTPVLESDLPATASRSGCRRTRSETWSRRQFLAAGAMAGGVLASGRLASVSWGAAPSELLTQSATELASRIRKKEISSVEIVEACLRRIESLHPMLNAVVTVCGDRAMAEAKMADSRLARGDVAGPLHGVPFTLKDSIETEGVVTTAGSLGLRSWVPTKDATVAARLRKAGAILLGKTNTPEFTLGGFNRGTYNLVFGQTNNPYNTAHTPRGSSGGAGAIVAACGSPFDIGSDFGGSIRSPAHACGIAGVKPTTGRVPRTGHWPGYGGAFDSYQQLGPMARWMVDMITLLPIVSGPDFRDAAAVPAPLGDPAKVDLKSLRVAFYTDNGVVTPTPETQAMVRAAARAMSEAGAMVKEDFHGGDAEGNEIRQKLTRADGGAWYQRLLDKAGTTEPSPGIRRNLTGNTIPTSEFTDYMERQDALRSRLLGWMKNYDIILCPTNAFPAPAHDRPVPQSAGYTSIYNLTTWPACVVRYGTSAEGLPLGLQIVGQPWREDHIFAVGQFLEKTGGWKAPSMLLASL